MLATRWVNVTQARGSLEDYEAWKLAEETLAKAQEVAREAFVAEGANP